MRFLASAASTVLALSSLLASVSASIVAKPAVVVRDVQGRAVEYVVKPKVMIINMFAPEAEIWYGIPEFDILAVNITLPGASPLFPHVHCTADGDICQVVSGPHTVLSPCTNLVFPIS